MKNLNIIVPVKYKSKADLYFGVVTSNNHWSLLKSLIVVSDQHSVYNDSTTVLHILTFLSNNL